jgi:hypothetical protein
VEASRVLEVGYQVLDILDAHGQAQRAVTNAAGCPLFRRECRVGHGGRVTNE